MEYCTSCGHDPSKRPSVFVDVLGWIALIGSIYGVFAGVLQIAIFSLATPFMGMKNELEATGAQMEKMNVAGASRAVPAPDFLMILFPIIFLAVFGFILYASINLLKRENWARVSFQVFMVLGILYNLGITFAMTLSMANFPGPSGPQHPAVSFMSVMTIGMGLMAVGTSIALVWVIRKLRSPEIRSEFLSVVLPHDDERLKIS